MNQAEYIYVKKKIRELTRFDLENYAGNQMMRRLDGFISRYKAENITDYFKLLENDARELEKLQDFLTIHVSEFFRDAAYFNVLQEKILPGLLRQNRRLNIWSAGCSNGAEPYSVAMILENISPGCIYRILATDIDNDILRRAAAGGPYKAADVRNVAQSIGLKYMNTKEGSYWVNENLRKKVVFRQHDLTRDAFEGGFDLIMCRNVVIYFSEEAKKKLKQNFCNALKLNGVLFIGGTETMLDAAGLGFERLSACFYRKTADISDKIQPAGVVANRSKI
jgi:chemotaxis protein methyltransferase CheR